MIDIEKLEQLSCLKMAPNDKAKLMESLNGIFTMMHELDNVTVGNINKENIKETNLAEDSFSQDFIFSKEEKVEGLHLEQGYFLAPKVIKK